MNDTPGHKSTQRQPAEPIPGWIIDQADAAGAESRTRLDRLVDELGFRKADLSAHPVLVRQVLDRYLTEPLAAGRLTSCSHLVTPRPAWIHASKPGLVVCDACLPTSVFADPLAMRLYTAGKHCDVCRRGSVRFHQSTLAFGPLAILLNVCAACVEEVAAA